MTELTLNEYRSRLQVLAEKANAEGRHKLSEFTLRLLNQENPDLKVLDANIMIQYQIVILLFITFSWITRQM